MSQNRTGLIHGCSLSHVSHACSVGYIDSFLLYARELFFLLMHVPLYFICWCVWWLLSSPLREDDCLPRKGGRDWDKGFEARRGHLLPCLSCLLCPKTRQEQILMKNEKHGSMASVSGGVEEKQDRKRQANSALIPSQPCNNVTVAPIVCGYVWSMVKHDSDMWCAVGWWYQGCSSSTCIWSRLLLCLGWLILIFSHHVPHARLPLPCPAFLPATSLSHTPPIYYPASPGMLLAYRALMPMEAGPTAYTCLSTHHLYLPRTCMQKHTACMRLCLQAIKGNPQTSFPSFLPSYSLTYYEKVACWRTLFAMTSPRCPSPPPHCLPPSGTDGKATKVERMILPACLYQL